MWSFHILVELNEFKFPSEFGDVKLENNPNNVKAFYLTFL